MKVWSLDACGFRAIELLKNVIESKAQTGSVIRRVFSTSDDTQAIADAFQSLASLLDVFSVSTNGGYY